MCALFGQMKDLIRKPGTLRRLSDAVSSQENETRTVAQIYRTVIPLPWRTWRNVGMRAAHKSCGSWAQLCLIVAKNVTRWQTIKVLVKKEQKTCFPFLPKKKSVWNMVCHQTRSANYDGYLGGNLRRCSYICSIIIVRLCLKLRMRLQVYKNSAIWTFHNKWFSSAGVVTRTHKQCTFPALLFDSIEG